MNPEKRKLISISLLLAFLTLASYWPALHCDFVNYDDPEYVTENSMVRMGLTLEGFHWAWTTNHASNWHPFTWLSHMLDCQLYGLKPFGHHATNLALHLANTLLLFALLYMLTRATWRSAFVAAMFALHPTHVESVAWVSERKDVLSTFFGFLSTWFYIRFATGKSPTALSGFGRQRPGLDYSLALLFFAFSLLSKGMLVTLPFAWMLLDWWPLRRFPQADNKVRFTLKGLLASGWPLLREKLPFIALSVLVSAITYLVQLKMTAGPGIVSRLYTLTIPIMGYVRYIGKLLYPAKLAAFYPLPEVIDVLVVGVAAATLVVVSVVVFWRARQFPWLMVGWCWFLGTLVPVIGFVKVGYQSIADRYTYVPSIGFFIIIAWGLHQMLQRYSWQKFALGTATVGALAASIVLTRQQVSYWRNGETLFTRALAVTERNFIAHFSLGYLRQKSGDLAQAEEHYKTALTIESGYPEANCNYGTLLAEQGRYDEAIEHYKTALAAKPNYAEAYNNLGDALARKGQPEEAVAELRLAIQADPRLGEAYCNLGGVLVLLGQHQEAISPCSQAVQLIPDDYRTHYNLGCALAALGRSKEAIQCFRRAIQLKPDFPKALNELAWILATDADDSIRNGSEAVKMAERACDLTEHEAPPFLGTLDAAYAETGQFEKAIATAQKARDLALRDGQPELFILAKKRISLYEQRQPFRSEVARK